MDLLKPRRSFFDHVIEILLLTTVLAYAVIEILVCFLWNLALRIPQELRSLVTQGFQGSCKRGTLLRNDNNSQNCKTKQVAAHLPNADTSIFTNQNTKLETEIKPGCDAEFCWPLRSEAFRCRKKMSAAEDGSKTKDEHFNLQGAKTRTGKNDRTQKPRLLTTQWVTHKNVYKVGGDGVCKKDALSHRNSNTHPQSNCEAGHEKKVVCHQGKMFLVDSEDQRYFLREKEGGVDLRQGIFDSKLRRRGVNNGGFETFTKNTEMIESHHLRSKGDGLDSAKRRVIGCTQYYTPLCDWSGVAEEKGHSVGLELAGHATDQPVIGTDKMASATQVRKYFLESASLDGKINDMRPQKKGFHSPLTANHNITTGADEAPAQQYFEGKNKDNFQATKHQSITTITTTTTTEATATTTRAKQTDASGETTLTTSDFRNRVEKNQIKAAGNYKSPATQDRETDNSQAATTEGNDVVVHQEEGQTSEKFKSPPDAWIIQQENQEGKKVTNSSNFRLEKVKRSRLPFARTPRRGDLRKNKMPVL